MPEFNGFSGKANTTIQVPTAFFSEVLAELTDQDETKLVLFVFWYLQKRNENTGYVTLDELLEEPSIRQAYPGDAETCRKRVQAAAGKAVSDKLLLGGQKDGKEYYFVNSPRGAALLEGLKSGDWHPLSPETLPLPVGEERPNIFTLYEQNIGILTPLMADVLLDAEKTYPAEWINDAIKIAVERNARNWRFIEVILRSWKEKGRNEKDQQAHADGRKRDSEGEFSDFIRH